MLARPTETPQPSVPGPFASEPPGGVVELLSAVGADARRDSLRVALRAMAEADLRDILPTVAVPTLLIWGELDARSPLTVAREFARAIPQAELVVIPDAGLIDNLERPEEFNEAIRSFCGRS